MSETSRPACSRACCVASAASVDGRWVSSIQRRSWIPVRCSIHSSVVSIHCVISAFVTTRLPTLIPVPAIRERSGMMGFLQRVGAEARS